MTMLESFIGLFRRFRSAVLGREVLVAGRCNFCGKCCREIQLSDKGLWLRRKSQFDRLVASEPGYVRFEPVGRSESGFLLFTCTMLGADNSCTGHEERLPLCRNYPSKSLYYRGGGLQDDCGYSFRAVTFLDVLAGRKRFRPRVFSNVLDREIEQEKDKQT